MKQWYKGIRLFFALVILGGGSVLIVLWVIFGGLSTKGSSPIERWCGDQVRLIAADLLRPKLTFDAFEYDFPGTLTLRNVRLTDGDDVCLEAASMRLILRDVPTRGKPIVIDTVELTGPVVRIVVRDDGTLAGFTDFVDPSAGRKHADGGSSRPSDFLAVRSMTIKNGAFRWTASDGTMMELDELDFHLNGRPEGDPGWYTLDASLTRAPVLDLTMDGRFQIDKFILDLSKLSLDITLDEQTQKNLPPPLQSMLKSYEVQGKLAVSGTAMTPISDPTSATFNLKVVLTNAHVAKERLQIPLDRLTMGLELSDQLLTIDAIQAVVFGGHVEGNASIDFSKQLFTELTLTGDELRLERALKETAEIETNLAGEVTLVGSASATLDTFPADLDGSGHIIMKDGHLWGALVYKQMMKAAGKTVTGTDSGSMDFSLHPDRVELTKVRLVGSTTAAHGEGEMFFDQRINFRFNSGPIERVEKSMPIVGSMIKLATDRVMAYQITGTWSEPKFNVRPFRIGANPEKAAPEK